MAQPLPLGLRAGPAERLGAAASAADALGILETICDSDQMVAVYKSRHLLELGNCTLDDVRFRTEGGNYRSLGVESSSLSELRTLVQDLKLGRLGSPRNYMQFLAVLPRGVRARAPRIPNDEV